jgi:hypothetical protein
LPAGGVVTGGVVTGGEVTGGEVTGGVVEGAARVYIALSLAGLPSAGLDTVAVIVPDGTSGPATFTTFMCGPTPAAIGPTQVASRWWPSGETVSVKVTSGGTTYISPPPVVRLGGRSTVSFVVPVMSDEPTFVQVTAKLPSALAVVGKFPAMLIARSGPVAANAGTVATAPPVSATASPASTARERRPTRIRRPCGTACPCTDEPPVVDAIGAMEATFWSRVSGAGQLPLLREPPARYESDGVMIDELVVVVGAVVGADVDVEVDVEVDVDVGAAATRAALGPAGGPAGTTGMPPGSLTAAGVKGAFCGSEGLAGSLAGTAPTDAKVEPGVAM